MDKIAIIGVGQSNFSRNCGMSISELCFEAYREAMQGLDITSNDIDASIIASSPGYDKQRTPACAISDYLGFTPKPSFYIESGCSASSNAVRVAYAMVSAGIHRIVAIVGFQKMSEMTSPEAGHMMLRGSDIIWESPFGMTAPGGYAMYARGHMNKYNTTEEQLAKIRVKNSFYGALNEKATYRKRLSLEEILSSEFVASPLKKFDCCANADGASCVIVAKEDIAKRVSKIPIWIMGFGAATGSWMMSGRESFTSLGCAREAAKKAYEMAGVKPQDIDVAEVHDCFTIAEILAYEDLGFAKPGRVPALSRIRKPIWEAKYP